MVVSFLTLFLGLVWGEKPVSVAARSDVAAVEILLDGFVAARFESPQWKGPVDFGPELLAHELVAVALDARGQELGRARQLVNLPRPLAEASFILDPQKADGTRTARLSWHAVGVDRPARTDVTFDGLPVKVASPSRFLLPPYDGSTAHILRADLDFGRAAATAIAIVGGHERDETDANLTAVPVRLRARTALPPPAAMADWFCVDGKALTVEAVEEGPERVIFVVDESAERDLRRLGKRRSKDPPILLPPLAEWFVGLPKAARRVQTGYVYDVIPIEGPLGPTDGDFATVAPARMERVRLIAPIPKGVSFAVAAAAPAVTAGSRRRALVLVLGPSPRDADDLTPALVLPYLRSLNVPFYAIRVDAEEAASAWGRIRHASTREALRAAFAEIAEDVDGQRIVWLRGAHLPQSIALGPAAHGIEIAR